MSADLGRLAYEAYYGADHGFPWERCRQPVLDRWTEVGQALYDVGLADGMEAARAIAAKEQP